MTEAFFRSVFDESVRCKEAFIASHSHLLVAVADCLVQAFRAGNKLLLFGNGGSAADAQHLAAEFVNRLTMNRAALPAVALTTDTSVLTSIANDFEFATIYSRQIAALGRPGDIAWGFSTSGHSANVIEGFREAKRVGMTSVASLGNAGGRIGPMVDHALIVPSRSAQRIQEVHITLGHAVCEWVEKALFDSPAAAAPGVSGATAASP